MRSTNNVRRGCYLLWKTTKNNTNTATVRTILRRHDVNIIFNRTCEEDAFAFVGKRSSSVYRFPPTGNNAVRDTVRHTYDLPASSSSSSSSSARRRRAVRLRNPDDDDDSSPSNYRRDVSDDFSVSIRLSWTPKTRDQPPHALVNVAHRYNRRDPRRPFRPTTGFHYS